MVGDGRNGASEDCQFTPVARLLDSRGGDRRLLRFRLRHAYPVLDSCYREKVSRLRAYLDRFDNLKISGRSGTFSYTWTHDMIRFGREIVRAYCAERTSGYHAEPGTARGSTP